VTRKPGTLRQSCSCPPGFLFPNLDFEKRLDAVAEAGIRRVELWARTDRYADLDPNGAETEKVRAAVADRGLSIASLGAQTARDRGDVETALRLASELGAEIAVIGSKWNSLPVFLDHLDALRDTASECRVRLAVFNHVKGLLRTDAEMEMLCSRFDAEFVGLSLAPPHAAILGEDPMKLISRFGPRILQLWLWDLLPGVDHPSDWMEIVYTRGDEQLPGNGCLAFDRFVAALQQSDVAPQLNFLPHGVQEWPAEKTVKALRDSLEWLKKSNVW
jgi:sugar phosphate isomerase/epimerase